MLKLSATCLATLLRDKVQEKLHTVTLALAFKATHESQLKVNKCQIIITMFSMLM